MRGLQLSALYWLQVHIYLPEDSHPANNLVRAIVRDSNDNYTGTQDGSFLDSGLPSYVNILPSCTP